MLRGSTAALVTGVWLLTGGCAGSPPPDPMAAPKASSTAEPEEPKWVGADTEAPEQTPATSSLDAFRPKPVEAPGRPRPTGSPRPDEVRVNPYLRYQVMDGVGANCSSEAFINGRGWQWDKVAYVFAELRLAYLRVPVELTAWEPENDDTNPKNPNQEGYRAGMAALDEAYLPFARFAATHQLFVEPGIYDVPAWMGGQARPRTIPRYVLPELGESLATFHAHLAARGLRAPVVEVAHQPDHARTVYYPEKEDLVAAFAATIQQLDALGMSQAQLHGPNVRDPRRAAAWGAALLSSEAVAPRLRALSFHTWLVTQAEPFLALRSLAEKYRRPVWATEVGFCPEESGCSGGTHFLLPDTWDTALDYASSYWRAIHLSRATRVYHASLFGPGSAVSRDGRRLSSFFVLKHFANFIPPRSVYIGTGVAGTVLAMAFHHPDGRRAVILIRGGEGAKAVRLTDLVTPKIDVLRAVTTTAEATEKATERDDSGRLILPGRSITSVLYQAAGATSAGEKEGWTGLARSRARGL